MTEVVVEPWIPRPHVPGDWQRSSHEREFPETISRWEAEYASTLAPASSPETSLRGTLILRHGAERLVLIDGAERVVDARCLREAERVDIGGVIELPAHKVTPRALLPLSEAIIPVRKTPVTASGCFDHTVSLALGRGPNGDSPGPTATVPGQENQEGGGDKARDAATTPFNLPDLLSHFWCAARVPEEATTGDSFGWWRGKAGGDLRTFARVAASPPRQDKLQTPSTSTMGDRGGRFAGRRGGSGGGGGGGRNGGGQDASQGRNLVWHRDPPPGSSGGHA